MPNTSTINVADVKRHFARLLDRVAYGGETIIITRHGEPVARLVPFDVDIDRAEVRRTVAALKKFGRGIRLPAGFSLKDLINEGRP